MTGSRGVRGCAKFQSQHVNRTQTAAWINKEIIRSLPKARRTKKDFTTDLASSFDGEGWMYSCYFFHCICYVLFVFRTAIDHAEVAVAFDCTIVNERIIDLCNQVRSQNCITKGSFSASVTII